MLSEFIQNVVAVWVNKVFGERTAYYLPQRGLRFFEEAVELAQACACDKDQLHAYIEYVYARPVGTKRAEIGGVGVTLLALANAAGESVQRCVEDEVLRVLAKPDAHFAKRNAAKDAAGFKAL